MKAKAMKAKKDRRSNRVASDDGLGDEIATCQSGSDGDCFHKSCPQLRDGEPVKTDRHCPLDIEHEET